MFNRDWRTSSSQRAQYSRVSLTPDRKHARIFAATAQPVQNHVQVCLELESISIRTKRLSSNPIRCRRRFIYGICDRFNLSLCKQTLSFSFYSQWPTLPKGPNSDKSNQQLLLLSMSKLRQSGLPCGLLLLDELLAVLVHLELRNHNV